jgi:hypothetical protein
MVKSYWFVGASLPPIELYLGEFCVFTPLITDWLSISRFPILLEVTFWAFLMELKSRNDWSPSVLRIWLINCCWEVFWSDSLSNFDLPDYFPYLFGEAFRALMSFCCYFAEACSTVVMLNCLVFMYRGFKLLPAAGVLIYTIAMSLSKSSSSIFFWKRLVILERSSFFSEFSMTDGF